MFRGMNLRLPLVFACLVASCTAWAQAPDVVVVVITAYGTVERAVQAMKQGAYDFVLKPLVG